MPELMPVVTQRQRLLDVTGQWRETPEMIHPCRIIEPLQPDTRRGSVVAPPQNMLRKLGSLDRAIESVVKVKMNGRCAVLGHQP